MSKRTHDRFGKIMRQSCENDMHDLQPIAEADGATMAKCSRCGAVRTTGRVGEHYMPAAGPRTRA